MCILKNRIKLLISIVYTMGQIIYLHTSEFQVEVGQILGSTVGNSLFVQIQLSATIQFEHDLGWNMRTVTSCDLWSTNF